VQSLLEQEINRNQPVEWSDGCAPEQLQGRPASPASDVYALGMVVYYLLAGTPLFEGSTPEELAHQHLYTSLPPLNQVRGDLPPSLYGVLARALAKDPAQRFNQPGAFANAYHRSGVPTNRMRVPFVVSDMPGVQFSQVSDAGAPAVDSPLYERGRGNNGSNGQAAVDFSPPTPRPPVRSSNPHSLHGFPEDEPVSQLDAPRPALMRRFRNKQRQRMILISALVAVLVIAGSVIGISAASHNGAALSNASGQVTFFANQDGGGATNALRISIQNLAAPPSGDTYDAWIVDDQAEQFTSLGVLMGQGSTWTLTFSSVSINVLSAGDKIEVTQEQGAVTAPTGPVVLTGKFPVKSFAHIEHLLVGFPETPGQIGFLQGLLEQTHLLDNQAIVLQNAAVNKDTGATICLAQNMLNIIAGKHGANYKSLAGVCAQQPVPVSGDGYGILSKSGYAASAEEHASFAIGQPDATSAMRQHAALMNVALTDINGWLTSVELDLLNLERHPTDLSSLQEIVTLTDETYRGIDINGNGQIEPVAGEAGAMTDYQQGQQMATLTLAPNA
jgi:hypothetical protein